MEWKSYEHAVKMGEMRDEYAATALRDINAHPEGQHISFCTSGDTIVVALKIGDNVVEFLHARMLEHATLTAEEADAFLNPGAPRNRVV